HRQGHALPERHAPAQPARRRGGRAAAIGRGDQGLPRAPRPDPHPRRGPRACRPAGFATRPGGRGVTYDPATYWRERGETYAAKFDAPAYEEQERALAAVLAELDYATVLEVGCGFGRIARLLHGQYTGIDLS